MTSFAIPHFALWTPLALFQKLLSNSQERPSTSEALNGNSLIRRDFLLEMMQSHPEAFQSELDLQTMTGW